MTNVFKLISFTSFMAVTTSAAMAQDIPLNTIVSGAVSLEIVQAPVGGALVSSLGTSSSMATVGTVLVVTGASSATSTN